MTHPVCTMSDRNLDRRALLLAGAGVATTATLVTFEPATAGVRKRTKVFKGRFRGDVPDWHYLPFTVPHGVTRISVKYSYEPVDTGFGTSFNVVDIGIFDNAGAGLGNAKGFRGWSGGARRSFSISRTAATPGYLAGPITPGRWRIALGPYQLTGAGTPYRVEVTLHFGKRGPKFKPMPAPSSVPGKGAGWYRGDLHVHTVHSDGSQTQREVIAYAKAAGLDFIGTSEHNTTSATRTWGHVVPKDFLVIPGEEVTTRAGHWLAAGLPAGTWIDWRYRPEDGKLARFTEQVRSVGGLSIAAHPNQVGGGNGWGFGFTDIDAIEVWNGPWSDDDDTTVADWHALLSSGTFKPAVGNSDTHKQSQQIGLAQTVVRADSLSASAIIAGYRGGHSWIAGSSAVGLELTAARNGGTPVSCGDRLPSVAGDTVAVRLHVTGVAPGCVATLIGPGTATYGTATADAAGQLLLEQVVPAGTAFVRAEVRQTGSAKAAMVALTNPIFLS